MKITNDPEEIKASKQMCDRLREAIGRHHETMFNNDSEAQLHKIQVLEQKNTELEAINNMKPCVISFLSALRRLHPELETRCLNGSCFKLYLLLKEVWPDADPWYDGDHVIIKIGNSFYDIRGEVVPGRHIPMKDDALVFNTAYLWMG